VFHGMSLVVGVAEERSLHGGGRRRAADGLEFQAMGAAGEGPQTAATGEIH
jgi:hypothetical protein